MIFIIPEFESVQISIFENLITLLKYRSILCLSFHFVDLFSLQIQSMSISFVLGLCGGEHSLQRIVSSRVASKLSIDTIYDSSARKYYEYIIKSVCSINRFQLNKKIFFFDNFIVISFGKTSILYYS